MQTFRYRAAQGFVLVSAFALLAVSLMAFVSPQAVMDLVQVQLPTPDAFSSIRGVYGGVGLTLFLSLMYLLRHNLLLALRLLSLLWGFYALSRLLTILIEGPLGRFGVQWLVIETVFFILAVALQRGGTDWVPLSTAK